MDKNEFVCPANRAAWRRWLEKHHSRSAGVWLVFYKKGTGKQGLSYEEAVEEAICFGWIDSVIRRIDDETYGQRLTPRGAKSTWSATNIRRAEKMIREGRMTEAGLARLRELLPEAARGALETPAGLSGCGLADRAHPRPSDRPGLELAPELRAVLAADGRAHEGFLGLPPGLRKQLVAWIMDAKKDETRRRRLDKLIAILRTGRRPDLMKL